MMQCTCCCKGMSEKKMKLACSKGKLSGLKSVDIGLCMNCAMGKHKRVSFSKTSRILKNQKLKLVHTIYGG